RRPTAAAASSSTARTSRARSCRARSSIPPRCMAACGAPSTRSACAVATASSSTSPCVSTTRTATRSRTPATSNRQCRRRSLDSHPTEGASLMKRTFVLVLVALVAAFALPAAAKKKNAPKMTCEEFAAQTPEAQSRLTAYLDGYSKGGKQIAAESDVEVDRE